VGASKGPFEELSCLLVWVPNKWTVLLQVHVHRFNFQKDRLHFLFPFLAPLNTDSLPTISLDFGVQADL
jgi:hypothetical protein